MTSRTNRELIKFHKKCGLCVESLKNCSVFNRLFAFRMIFQRLMIKPSGSGKTCRHSLPCGLLCDERLLKTVVLLLEDFDPSGLRLLVSMVPPPTNSPQETIKEIFSRATGYTRLEAPIFQK
uniref:LutB protein n=1 Tax=Fopius arisanus TaxID=64838 RepID=A0A0C9R4S7_9HYME